MRKREEGITLMVLIIMIIVLLILAGITLGSISNHNGVIEQSKEATQSAQRESIIEKIEADLYSEKTKTGKEQSKTVLKNIIVDNNYGTINEDDDSFTTKEGNYKINFSEIAGWENEYKQLAYLESTGTQYIDTGYILTSNSKVEIEFNITSKESMCIFGSRTSATSNNFDIFYDEYYAQNGEIAVVVDFYDYTKNRLIVREDINKKITVVQSKDEAIVNETRRSNSYFEYKTPTNAYIFYIANNQPYPNCYAKMKLYSCKIWDNGNLIRDFIPVLDENSVVCLYDKIDRKYYYNQGTGEFLYDE